MSQGAAPQMTQPLGYELQNNWFDQDIIDTDHDGKFDLSVCFGQVGQGVYEHRADLLAHLRAQMARGVEGDDMVDGRAYERGFVSSGDCQPGDGSSVKIEYYYSSTDGHIAYTSDNNDDSPKMGEWQYIIHLNSYYIYSWVDPVEWYKIDGNSVVIHEMLHAWGLYHSDIGDALMAVHMNENCALPGEGDPMRPDDFAGQEAKYSFLNSRGWIYQPVVCTD